MPRPTTQMMRPKLRRSARARIRAAGANRSSEDGQATVEFALVLPIIVIVLLGIVLFGVALNDWIDETHLASEAVRFASVDSEHGTGSITESEPKAFLKWITEQGDNTNVKNAKATVCAPSSGIGEPVTVKLEYTYNWFGLANLLGVEANTKIVSTATERISQPPPGKEAYPTTC